MYVSIPYGEHVLRASLNAPYTVQTLDIADTAPLTDLNRALLEGLNAPRGNVPPLADQLPKNGTVTIIVSDSFRKTGVERVLPGLLEYLRAGGVADERISFLFATGSHRPPTEKEKAVILGQKVYERFRGQLFSHDPHDKENLVFKGETSRSTPIYINRRAAEAGCVILTGTVVLHYFGGYGGGRKSVVPGIAGVRTIAANHALNLHPKENQLHPDVAIGRMAGNPVAEDMLEGAQRCGEFFLINTVLNRQGDIAGLFCGDMVAAHDAACAFAGSLFGVSIDARADLTIASAGAAKNFIQSHKALYNAFQATKPGGAIILAAPAPEGYGGNRFVEWLALGNRDAIIAELRRNAEINGQTALSTLEKARNTIFITELSAEEVQALGGRKARDLDEAIAMAETAMSIPAGVARQCYLMPSAGYTVPELAQK